MSYQKYKAKSVTINGIKFASKLEGDRYQQLMLLQRAGEITDLQCQVELQIFEGYINCYTGEKHKSRYYVADFKYIDLRTKQTIIEDTKGVETDVFKLKWELAQATFPEWDFRKLTRKDV